MTDISSATSPSFSDVKEWKDNAIDKIIDVNENLESFTSTGDEADVDEIMQQIEAVMESVQTSNGQARFTNFSGISMIKELQKLNAYNQLRTADSDKIVEEISQKLMNGEALNSEEREILYQHIQAELTLEDRKHITTLSSKIEDEEAMKAYINAKVLYSEANLEEEIILLEKYLYAGNERPIDLPGSTDDRAKLHSYLDILKNYYIAINELKNEPGSDWSNHGRNDPLFARVEQIKLATGGDTKNNNYFVLKSEITIEWHQGKDKHEAFTRESYVEAPLPGGYANVSEVTYYRGKNAISGMINQENQQEKAKLDNMNNEFYRNKLMGYILGGGKEITQKATGKSIKLHPAMALTEEIIEMLNHSTEKANQQHVVNLKDHEEIAINLSVELKVNERNLPHTWNGKSRQIEIYPTDETYEVLARWEAIHHEFPDKIPYDKEAVKNEDWEQIHNTFGGIDESKHEELYDYITKRFTNGQDYHNVILEIEEELYPRDD